MVLVTTQSGEQQQTDAALKAARRESGTLAKYIADCYDRQTDSWTKVPRIGSVRFIHDGGSAHVEVSFSEHTSRKNREKANRHLEDLGFITVLAIQMGAIVRLWVTLYSAEWK